MDGNQFDIEIGVCHILLDNLLYLLQKSSVRSTQSILVLVYELKSALDILYEQFIVLWLCFRLLNVIDNFNILSRFLLQFTNKPLSECPALGKQLRNLRLKMFLAERLRYEGISTERDCFRSSCIIILGSKHDDRDMTNLEILPYLLKHFHSRHLRHHLVGNNQVGTVLADFLQALDTVYSAIYIVLAAQLHLKHVAQVLVVLNEQKRRQLFVHFRLAFVVLFLNLQRLGVALHWDLLVDVEINLIGIVMLLAHLQLNGKERTVRLYVTGVDLTVMQPYNLVYKR